MGEHENGKEKKNLDTKVALIAESPFIFVVYGHSEREKRLWGKKASPMKY